MTIAQIARKMKLESPVMASQPETVRNQALEQMRLALLSHREEIFAANAKDMEKAQEDHIPQQVCRRLAFNEAKLQDVCAGLSQLQTLTDPVGRILLDRQLDEGLELYRVSVPIGVIGVIFEARPDALVQISGLCVKSGNCAILKGGRESARTNKALFDVLYEAAVRAGLPDMCLVQVEERNQIDELLACEGDVDLLIPRGSNAFVRYIMDHTRIPVMGHADGVCHIYVDGCADEQMELNVIRDAKTQYPVACNAVETVLVKRSLRDTFLPSLKKMLDEAGVTIYGTEEVSRLLGCAVMEEDDFHKEYGDLSLSLKLVDNVQEAVDHINRYGSHHTDCILTDDDEAAEYFLQMIDSAGVYRNCSTRFADGFRYGFGAEVGISTSKLHARGPVGLEGLVTYKYKLIGHGQTVGDYASGKRSFHFADRT